MFIEADEATDELFSNYLASCLNVVLKNTHSLHTASSLRPHTHFLTLRAATIKTLSAED